MTCFYVINFGKQAVIGPAFISEGHYAFQSLLESRGYNVSGLIIRGLIIFSHSNLKY